MKHDTFDKYPAGSLELPVRALLTAWDCLADFRNELVLVGGLAIRYLTNSPAEGMPGPVTMDVDFGVSIGADEGAFPRLRELLSEQGFHWINGRFTRAFPELKLHIDLLTDDGRSDTGTTVIGDGLNVSIFPGVNRALELHRSVAVSGETLAGAPRAESIKVAEVGPLLVLKLNAFGGPRGRKEPKDAHDILYLAMNYLDGNAAAVAGFREEKRLGNRGFAHALQCLKDDFAGAHAIGPVRCAAFRLNNLHEEPENEAESQRIREQCVSLAMALLA